jgi:hypothetical protein
MIVFGELKKTGEKAAMAHVKVLSQQLPGGSTTVHSKYVRVDGVPGESGIFPA